MAVRCHSFWTQHWTASTLARCGKGKNINCRAKENEKEGKREIEDRGRETACSRKKARKKERQQAGERRRECEWAGERAGALEEEKEGGRERGQERELIQKGRKGMLVIRTKGSERCNPTEMVGQRDLKKTQNKQPTKIFTREEYGDLGKEKEMSFKR